MMLRIVVVLALAAAVAFSPASATAHERHDQRQEDEKCQEIKGEQAAAEWRLARPAA